MATSNTEICNMALAALGLAPISSLANDASQAGIHCRIKWPETRDEILRAAFWRCLMARTGPLAADAAAPAFGYDYRFALPSDCVRVMELSVDVDWTVEGGFLLTSEELPYIRYISYDKAADQVVKFDAHLTTALAAELAAKLAPGLKSASRLPALVTLARDALANAKFLSAIEARPVQANPTALLDVR